MGKVFNALQLQGVLLLWIICAANGAPYSKYGRSCKDIGCLPREVCIMAYESCSFGQQENSNCGRYPTCKKNTDQAATQQNTDSDNNKPYVPSAPPSNNPSGGWNLPTTTRYVYTTTTTTTPRTTTTTTTTRRPWNTTPKSYYNPATPSYTPGGGGGFFGNRYGDTDYSGGSSITRPTTRFTTKKPAGTFDSLFSGFQNALSGQVGNFIQSALSGGGGGGGSSSGFGSFFNTRPVQQSRGSFGLFSENTNANTNTNLNSRSGSAYPTSGTTYTRYAETPVNPTPPQYGWKLS
ncbi:unnamed protein product [Diamesa tonsa]